VGGKAVAPSYAIDIAMRTADAPSAPQGRGYLWEGVPSESCELALDWGPYRDGPIIFLPGPPHKWDPKFMGPKMIDPNFLQLLVNSEAPQQAGDVVGMPLFRQLTASL